MAEYQISRFSTKTLFLPFRKQLSPRCLLGHQPCNRKSSHGLGAAVPVGAAAVWCRLLPSPLLFAETKAADAPEYVETVSFLKAGLYFAFQGDRQAEIRNKSHLV